MTPSDLIHQLDAALSKRDLGRASDGAGHGRGGWIRIDQLGTVYSMQRSEAERYLAWLNSGHAAGVNCWRAGKEQADV
jgi:hypothetical protein